MFQTSYHVSLVDPILIVDDEKDNLDALTRLLRTEFQVTATTSALAAIKKLHTEDFNMVISDQRMPEMTGVELLEKIKQMKPVTTRILLTGYTDIDSIIGAINRGQIYRYIAKPWDPEDLRMTVRQANEASRLKQELKKKNQELLQSNEELRLLDASKARFLSLISHELNTPLTSLQAFVALLSEKKNEFSSEIKKAVGHLSKSTDRFSEIISEVLTYVRLTADPKITRTPFKVLAEITLLKKELEKELGKPIKIKNSSEVVLNLDREKIKIALRSLLKDSLVRSPEGQEVFLEIINVDPVSVIVERSGEVLTDNAFKPLETASNEMTHHRNLGLLLAICRLVVEAHGGTLQLDSKSSKKTRIVVCFGKPPRQPT